MNENRVAASPVRSALRHRRVIILLCGLVGLLAGWILAQAQPPTYTGTTQVYVYPLTGNPYSPGGINDELTSLETEAEIVGSDAVLEEVARTEDVPESTLKKNLAVSVPPNTQLLDISFQAEERTTAADTAESLAKVYLDYREERTQLLFERRIESIDDRIEEVVAEIGSQGGQTLDPELDEFEVAMRRALNSELINLRAQRVDLLTDSSQSGRITRMSEVSGGGALLTGASLGAGLVLGLLAGLTLALALERRRGRVWGAEEVRAVGLPVLAQVTGDRRGDDVSAAVRRVRSVILDVFPPHTVVAVAPAGKGAVEPGFASALAVSLAKAGKSVLLVDAHLPGEIQLSTKVRHEPGLLELLDGHQQDAGHLIQPTGIRHLWSLPRGASGDDISEHFVTEKLAVLKTVAEQFDYVVIQAPSLNSHEGELVARVADASVVVLTSGGASVAELAELVGHEGASPVGLVGAVVLPRGSVVPRHRAGDPTNGESGTETPLDPSLQSTPTVRS